MATQADIREPVVGRATPLILGGHDFHSITEVVSRVIERPAPRGWWLVLGLSLAALGGLGIGVPWLFWEGIGVWGLNVPVGWAWDITNFVFWVGIGHAGTLISAILLLFRQRWRTSINRAAEAMTIFAVLCALTYPGIHVGRVWVAYWMAPLPNQMGTWPNFRSPLLWDVFAVSIYGTVSALFWYVGLIPDLATQRDRSRTRLRQWIYGGLALGWRGSQRHWRHYEVAYLILAGLATPLVLSVHSIVSMDFAVSQLPGWHTTIFPPYFVAGAIFSGFAMVVTLMVVCRWAFGLGDIITMRHFDYMAKVILATSWMVGYAYGVEFFTCVVQRQPLRGRGVPQPRDRRLRVGLLDDGHVQRPRSAAALAGEDAPQPRRPLRDLHLRQRRDVVRALRHHRDVAPPRLPALVVGILPPDDLGRRVPRRRLRSLLHALLPVRALRADGGGGGGEDGPARGLAAPPRGRPASRRRQCRQLQPLEPRGAGLVAEFETPAALYRACELVRDAGFSRWDAHTPFPVHGLDRAMGLGRSPLPWIVLAGALLGGAGGFALQAWVHASAYPLVISGKPLFAWPAYVPVTFELSVLGGALGAVLGMLHLNRLPRHHHPLFSSAAFERASDDRFFVSIDADDPRFEPRAAVELLRDAGAAGIEWLAA